MRPQCDPIASPLRPQYVPNAFPMLSQVVPLHCVSNAWVPDVSTMHPQYVSNKSPMRSQCVSNVSLMRSQCVLYASLMRPWCVPNGSKLVQILLLTKAVEIIKYSIMQFSQFFRLLSRNIFLEISYFGTFFKIPETSQFPPQSSCSRFCCLLTQFTRPLIF